MFAIMKVLYDTGFDGPSCPDHCRAIWGEIAMPGYGLYNGLWEAIEKATAKEGEVVIRGYETLNQVYFTRIFTKSEFDRTILGINNLTKTFSRG
jgi:hypothetical protein